MLIINSSSYLEALCAMLNAIGTILCRFGFLKPLFHDFFRVCYKLVTKDRIILTNWDLVVLFAETRLVPRLLRVKIGKSNFRFSRFYHKFGEGLAFLPEFMYYVYSICQAVYRRFSYGTFSVFRAPRSAGADLHPCSFGCRRHALLSSFQR